MTIKTLLFLCSSTLGAIRYYFFNFKLFLNLLVYYSSFRTIKIKEIKIKILQQQQQQCKYHSNLNLFLNYLINCQVITNTFLLSFINRFF